MISPPKPCMASSARTCRRAQPRRTDGWSAYPGAPGVSHDPHVIGKMAAHVVLPWVHRVFSNLKTWALGVYHGLRRKHIQSYLDEFTFRFNRRQTRHAAFKTLAWHRGATQTNHLQDVDRTGGNGISLSKTFRPSGSKPKNSTW